jgi:hypothetical protein
MPTLFIACTALLATAVLFVRGNSCGHDFDFHLLSWMEVARAWHAGLLNPHWVQDANYGAGEPRLIFYPPASWVLGALLGIATSWHAAPVLFILLALAASGGSMYLLAREWAPAAPATFAACLYVANPYAMFVAYERSAFGELLAAAWLPLMVLFALRKGGSIAPLALSVAALWLTNSPAAVVGSYLLAALALGLWIAEGKSWPAQRAAGGMVLGLGLAAFYILPAAFEQRWVQIDRAITPGMRVEDSFLFAITANDFHNRVLHKASWILILELAGASIAAYLAWRKRSGGTARIVLTGMLPIILLLQLPVSEVIWKYTPHMKFLQFPWRWLMALSVAGCALGSMAVVRQARWRIALVGSGLAAVGIASTLLFFQPCDDEDAVVAQLAGFRAGQGNEGTDEYTPLRVDNTAVQQNLPLVRVLRTAQDDRAEKTATGNPLWRAGDAGSIAARVETRRPDGEHWRVNIETPESGYAVLRLMDYPSWQVSVDDQPTENRLFREDGLITVPITAGSHVIEVQWTATGDVVAGRAISAIALLALAAVAVREQKGRGYGRV